MNNPKKLEIEWVSDGGHEVDSKGNCYTESGCFLTKLEKVNLARIKTGSWAGFKWHQVNLIEENE